MKKASLLNCFAIISLTASLSSQNNFLGSNNQLKSKETILEYLKKDIMEKSVIYKEKKNYFYNGKEYNSKDEIIYELLNNNPITLEKTISNPNKIIENFNTNKLIANKIYSTDSKDLMKLYLNSMNKIVLPSCFEVKITNCVDDKRSSKQRTLDSYVNSGMFKPKYSYDYIDWFDSPKEAEEEFKNNKYDVQSSLFYVKDGYYNAFNLNQDIKAKLNPGVYYDAFGNTNGTTDPITKNFFKQINSPNVNENFATYFINELENYITKNINDILFSEYKYKITFNAGKGENTKEHDGNNLNQWFGIVKNDFSKDLKIGLKGIEDGNPGTMTLEYFNSFQEKYNFQWKNFNKSFKDLNAWNALEIDDNGQNLKENLYRYHWFEYKVDNKVIKILLKISKDQSSWLGNDTGYNDTLPGNIKGSSNVESSDKQLGFRLVAKNSLFNQFSNRVSLNNVDSTKLVNYLSSKNGNWDIQQVLNEITNFRNLSNISASMLSYISEFLAQEIMNSFVSEADKNNGSYKAPLHNDFLYGNNNSYSYYKTKEDFDKKFIEDIKEQNNNEDINYSYQGINFTTNYENWKNNFQPFIYENNNGIPLKRMYFVGNTKKDISEYEDVNGMFLANSIGEAKDIYFNYDFNTLKKMYHVYDINGKEYKLYTSNEQEAKEKLENQVAKKYKLVHKDEVATLDDQQTNVEDIISDGEHIVYKFKDEKGNYEYYKDYESAYDAYLLNLNLDNSVSILDADEYIYSFQKNGITSNYFWWKEEQIDNIVTEIYSKYYLV